MSPGGRQPFVICITGPECTGKSTLARDLSEALGCEAVPEYAREYSSSLESPVGQWSDDKYLALAAEQYARIEAAVSRAHHFLVCDTDPFSVWVWHRFYRGSPMPALKDIAERTPCSLRILCGIDVPWVDDGVRDSGRSRESRYLTFLDEAARARAPLLEVSGSPGERVTEVIVDLSERSL